MLKRMKMWRVISGITILVSIIVIAVIRPVWGIDFVGGSLMEVEADTTRVQEIREFVGETFEFSASVQSTYDGSVIIRTENIDEAKHQEVLSALRDADLIGSQERRFESVGPTIGDELRRKSVIAILFVVVMMVGYLAYTFRSVKGLIAPWKFGIAAVYALVHDLVIVTAFFVIFGKYWGAPIDTLFVTAQLAILGYSVNDTIVLFNRMKWEWIADRSANMETIIQKAIKATLTRSLNTSFTTLLVLIALLVFGGSTIRWFITALAIGTVTGTYSSLLVAPPLLHYLSKRRKR